VTCVLKEKERKSASEDHLKFVSYWA